MRYELFPLSSPCLGEMQAALADLRIPRMEVTMGEDGEEPDLELDDDPELAASLDTTRVPLILTISQVLLQPHAPVLLLAKSYVSPLLLCSS